MEKPKEKAKELVDKFENLVECDNIYETPIHSLQIECAKIAVDEILNFQIKTMKWSEEHNGNIHFWQEVKQELEKL